MSHCSDGAIPDRRHLDANVLTWPMVRSMTDGGKRALWAFLRLLPALTRGGG